MATDNKEERWHRSEDSSKNKRGGKEILGYLFSNKYPSTSDECMKDSAISLTDTKGCNVKTDMVNNKAFYVNEEERDTKVIINSSLEDATNANSFNNLRKSAIFNETQEKRGIIKNLLIICIAFMLLFTAFISMSALQSSINKVDGLGTWSNTAIYASLVLSSMFLPSYVIKTLTAKWTLPVCMICYTIYICTQFYPEFYTIVPSGILVGIAAAPLWSAKCIYVTQVAERYAKLTSVDVEPIIARFFGIFFFFFRGSSLWGNLISSLVLRKDRNGNKTDANITLCGIYYCPDTHLPEDNFLTTHDQLYTLSGTYLACSIIAWVFVAIFLDPLEKYTEGCSTDSYEQKQQDKTNLSLLIATFKHIAKPYQLCIIPLTIWSGLEKGFFLSDFTAGFISCIFGVSEVGWVLITYGVSNAISSLSFGVITKYTGRLPLYLLGAFINLTVIIILLIWTPDPGREWVFFVIAGIWGIADGVWQTQINALYGVLFANDKEAAFSNYRLWESTGYLIAFILQTQVCIKAKLYILLSVVVMGMVGYFIIEINEHSNKKPKSTITEAS